MDRRRFVTLIGGALASPLAHAQRSGKVYRVGWPSAISRDTAAPLIDAFARGLKERGLTVGQDVAIEFRYSGGGLEKIPDLIRDLVSSKVDVLVTGTNPITSMAKLATQSIPIVFAIGIDVVGGGFAKSLARPGGNLTGLTWDVGGGSWSKRLELLREALPGLARVAVIYDPRTKTDGDEALEKSGKTFSIALHWQELTGDFERDIEAVVRDRVQAIFFISGAQQFTRRSELIALLTKRRLPASFGASEFVDAGGLMSYGPNIPDLYRRAATYVDKILKGARPADLPVEQPVRIDLVINLATARKFGLKLPQTLLLRADQVIE